jgi:hypothetical protein
MGRPYQGPGAAVLRYRIVVPRPETAMTRLVRAFPSQRTPRTSGETEVLGPGTLRTRLVCGVPSLRTAVPCDETTVPYEETAVSGLETGLTRLVSAVLGRGTSVPRDETAVLAKNRPPRVDFWSSDGKSEIGAGMSL